MNTYLLSFSLTSVTPKKQSFTFANLSVVEPRMDWETIQKYQDYIAKSSGHQLAICLSVSKIDNTPTESER